MKTSMYVVLIIQLCFVEYKYRAKRVQISHDICTRLIPPGRVKFKTLASQNFEKRNRWIINLLLDVLVCSIAVYFLLVVCILTRPTGSSKYRTTRKNIQRYFTPKRLIRYIYLASPCLPCFRSRLYNRLEELFKVERYGGKSTCEFRT